MGSMAMASPFVECVHKLEWVHQFGRFHGSPVGPASLEEMGLAIQKKMNISSSIKFSKLNDHAAQSRPRRAADPGDGDRPSAASPAPADSAVAIGDQPADEEARGAGRPAAAAKAGPRPAATAAGELASVGARRMLELNDEALTALQRPQRRRPGALRPAGFRRGLAAGGPGPHSAGRIRRCRSRPASTNVNLVERLQKGELDLG